MAKAYKCDICKEYCEDVFTVHGLSEPETHNVGVFGVAVDCCEDCYNKICEFAFKLINKKINDSCNGCKYLADNTNSFCIACCKVYEDLYESE